MYTYHVHAWRPGTSEEAIKTPGTEITDGCEPRDEPWESNLGLLREPHILLTVEPSLQLLRNNF